MESPRILDLSWGKILVEGFPPFKDAKLYPGGGREWNWTETGTRHSPGIQIGDVEELVEHGAEAVVLSRGMLKRLKICPGTRQFLEAKGIAVYALSTPKAVQTYNRLRETTAIGGVFHSTC